MYTGRRLAVRTGSVQDSWEKSARGSESFTSVRVEPGELPSFFPPTESAREYTSCLAASPGFLRDTDRMPVILPPGEFAAWLDPRTPAAEVGALLRPYPAEEMTAVSVGR